MINIKDIIARVNERDKKLRPIFDAMSGKTVTIGGKTFRLINKCCECNRLLPDGEILTLDKINEMRDNGIEFSDGYCKKCFVSAMVENTGCSKEEAEERYDKLAKESE